MTSPDDGQEKTAADHCECGCNPHISATTPDSEQVQLFWQEATKVGGLTDLDVVLGTNTAALVEPPAWQYSTDAALATALAQKTLSGEKTVSSTPLMDYELSGQPLPQVGDLGIVCDGDGQPVALVRTSAVSVVPFNEVLEETARAEGEPSLAHWRNSYGAYLSDCLDDVPSSREHGERGVPADDMVIETIECIYPTYKS